MDLLDKMKTYVRVVEAGSLTAAAKQLGISAAAVSRQIATLEAEVAVSLLARSTRRTVVTEEGKSYYERCLRVLREVEAQAIGERGGVEGVLKVTAPVTFGIARVVPHLHSLMTKHPGLRVDLRLEDRIVDLVLEGVDVAIRAGAVLPSSTDLVAHRLASHRRVVVASPRYLKRRGEPKTPEALAKHATLNHAALDASDTWTLIRDGRETRVRVDGVFRSNALFALRELAVRGAGITMLPDWFAREEIERGSLLVVLADWTSDPVVAHALHRVERRGAPRVRAFIDHLRAAYGREAV